MNTETRKKCITKSGNISPLYLHHSSSNQPQQGWKRFPCTMNFPLKKGKTKPTYWSSHQACYPGNHCIRFICGTQPKVKSFHANGNQERTEYLYLYLTKYMLSQKQSQQTNKIFTNNKIVESAEKYNNYECICSQHQRI